MLYSDIVVPPHAVGFGIDVAPGTGPVAEHPFRSAADLDRLRPLEPADVAYVTDTVDILVRELPDIATVERSPDKRDGKVYLDFLQNRRSQTIVPPYAVRPVRGASVSTPLAWDELEDPALSPRNFTIVTMPPRLAERGDLFRAALDDPQDLAPAIAALEQVLRGG